MKIIDITYPDLDHFYNSLLEKLSMDISKQSTISVVGIANSGLALSKPIHEKLVQSGYQATHFSVTCRRPHSGTRDFASGILKYIPSILSKLLRTIEHHLLQNFRNKQRNIDFHGNDISIANCNFILIVDDAVDSGYSLKAVQQNIQIMAPNAKIKTAAYVITQKNPVIVPDIFQHRDVIVRFPWVMDRP